MKKIKRKDAERLWKATVDDHLTSPWRGISLKSVALKMKKVSFDKSGQMIRDQWSAYAKLHFPSIIVRWNQNVFDFKKKEGMIK